MTPEELANLARELVPHGNIGVAYTYNEPLVGYEYVRDCAEHIHQAGLLNVLVSNGIIEEKPWRELLPLIDAANIDLKGFNDSWYRSLSGDLATVKRNIVIAAEYCHVEVTTLIIPGSNDSLAEMQAEAKWLAAINPDIPLHISRFFPRHHMTNHPPTPVDTIYHLADIAREHLQYVYTGKLLSRKTIAKYHQSTIIPINLATSRNYFECSYADGDFFTSIYSFISF